MTHLFSFSDVIGLDATPMYSVAIPDAYCQTGNALTRSRRLVLG